MSHHEEITLTLHQAIGVRERNSCAQANAQEAGLVTITAITVINVRKEMWSEIRPTFSTKCNFLFTLILHNHIGSPLHVYTHTHTHFYVHTISFIFPDTQFLNLHSSILIDTSTYIVKILLREVFSQNCEWTCLDIKLLLKVLSIYPLLLASFLLDPWKLSSVTATSSGKSSGMLQSQAEGGVYPLPLWVHVLFSLL